MALYTPEYKPNGEEIAVITTDEGADSRPASWRGRAHHIAGNFVELFAQKGLLRWPEAPSLCAGLRHPGRLSQHARDVRGRRRRRQERPRGHAGHRSTLATPSRASGRPTPTTRTRTARWPWRASSMPDSAGSQVLLLPRSPALPRYRLHGLRRHHRGRQPVIGKLRAGSVIENITIENAD